MFKLVSAALQLLPELVQFCLQHLSPLPLIHSWDSRLESCLGYWTDKLNVETDRCIAEYCVGMTMKLAMSQVENWLAKNHQSLNVSNFHPLYHCDYVRVVYTYKTLFS